MDQFPNEVVRMFLEHLLRRQRSSVARVSSMWRFLVTSFPPPSRQYPKYSEITAIYISNKSSVDRLKKRLEDDQIQHIEVFVWIDKETEVPSDLIDVVQHPKVVSLRNERAPSFLPGTWDRLVDNDNFMRLEMHDIPFNQSALDTMSYLIRHHPTLMSFTMSKSNVGINNLDLTDFAAAIAGNKTIILFDIVQNALTDVQKKVLLEAFKKNTCIEKLYLQQNGFTDDDVEQLDDLLRSNTRLKRLTLGGDNITQTKIEELQKEFGQRVDAY
jgi:hypothetical protein